MKCLELFENCPSCENKNSHTPGEWTLVDHWFITDGLLMITGFLWLNIDSKDSVCYALVLSSLPVSISGHSVMRLLTECRSS